MHPGDLVLADDDGVVVGSVDEIAAAIDGAEAIQTREEALRASAAEGEDVALVLASSSLPSPSGRHILEHVRQQHPHAQHRP